jgi:isopenicillin-N N-acyltransferase like protein
MSIDQRVRFFSLISILITLPFMCWPVEACTLWAASGDQVSGGGTLIAKNRDWKPDQRNVLKIVTPDSGMRYYGLFAEGDGKSKLRAGMNERGLVVVSASPPFTDEQLRYMPSKGVMREILARCGTLKEAFDLVRNASSLAPGFLMLADKDGIGAIEIGPKGKNAVQRATNGVMYHTNHYLDSGLLQYNPLKLGASTIEREKHIKEFLASQGAYGLNDFIRMSQSKEGGPNNSIWRDGRNPTATRTVASWIVWQPKEKSAEIYVRLANPGEALRDVRRVWKLSDGKSSYIGNPLRADFEKAESLKLMGSRQGSPELEVNSEEQPDTEILAREIEERDFDDSPELGE